MRVFVGARACDVTPSCRINPIKSRNEVNGAKALSAYGEQDVHVGSKLKVAFAKAFGLCRGQRSCDFVKVIL